MRNRAHISLVLVLLLMGAATLARTTRAAAQQTRGIAALVTEDLAYGGAPGAVMAIVVRDSLAYVNAWGHGDAQRRARMDDRRIFSAGGLTQLVTALAASRLAQEGGLDLDRPIGEYVPDVPPQLAGITLDQLLSHTAGLAYQPAVPGRGGEDDLGAAARRLTYLDAIAQPGAIYSYSLSGALLAAHALERAAGMGYADLLRTSVFEPLGMHDAVLGPERLDPASVAIGYNRTNSPDRPLAEVRPQPDSALLLPVRGLYLSVSDMARLAGAILNDGVIGGERVLPEGTVQRMLTRRTTHPVSATTQVILGATISDWHGRPRLYATSTTGGHNVTLQLFLDAGLGVISVTNMSSGGIQRAAEVVARRNLGIPDRAAASPPPTRPGPPGIDAQALAGEYSNGGEVLELIEDDGALKLRTGAMELAVTLETNGVYTARIADGRAALSFRIVQDNEGRPYIWVNDRALGRRTDR
jgi:CubicO group peptidase (beta-lactamase class C family)